MKKLKIEGPQDVFEIVKRRKWLIIVPFLLLTIVAGMVVFTKVGPGPTKEYLLPDIYQSETLVIVEELKVPVNLPDFDNGATMDRLSTLQQQILSRTNLEKVVVDFNLYNDFRLRLTRDDKIMALSHAIKVDIGTTQRETTTKVAYFKLAYENRDPVLAMKVTNRLAQLFIEYDYRARIAKANAAIEFFTNELKLIEATLNEAESKNQRYRMAHINELPETVDRNIRMAEHYQTKAKNAAEELDKTLLKLERLKKELAQQPQFLDKKIVKVTPGEKLEDGTPVKLEDELTVERKRLTEYRAKYTERHPDLVAQIKKVEELDRQKKEATRNVPPPTAGRSQTTNQSLVTVEPNPRYAELEKQITEEAEAAELARKNRELANADAAMYEQYTKNAPQRQMDLEAITRDLGSLRERYNKMRQQLTDAKMAGTIEGRKQGDSFKIQDPATQPTSPIKPKRTIYVLMAAAIGLGLGVILAVLRELFDEKIRTRAEIEGPLGLPVLVEIPEILNQREMQLKRIKKVLAFSVSIVLFVGVIGGVVQLFFKNYQVIVEYVILSGLV